MTVYLLWLALAVMIILAVLLWDGLRIAEKRKTDLQDEMDHMVDRLNHLCTDYSIMADNAVPLSCPTCRTQCVGQLTMSYVLPGVQQGKLLRCVNGHIFNAPESVP